MNQPSMHRPPRVFENRPTLATDPAELYSLSHWYRISVRSLGDVGFQSLGMAFALPYHVIDQATFSALV
jgi:hypothetical protein